MEETKKTHRKNQTRIDWNQYKINCPHAHIKHTYTQHYSKWINLCDISGEQIKLCTNKENAIDFMVIMRHLWFQVEKKKCTEFHAATKLRLGQNWKSQMRINFRFFLCANSFIFHLFNKWVPNMMVILICSYIWTLSNPNWFVMVDPLRCRFVCIKYHILISFFKMKIIINLKFT